MKKWLGDLLSAFLFVSCVSCASAPETERDMPNQTYLEMTAEALASLDDDAFLSAAISRIETNVNHAEELIGYDEDHVEEGFLLALNSVSEVERAFYVALAFDTQINNGMLHQFFCNTPYYVLAPYVSEALATIGAYEHKKLYDDFVKAYGLDLHDLNIPEVLDESEDAELIEAFEVFDEAYGELESIDVYLTSFARAHIGEF